MHVVSGLKKVLLGLALAVLTGLVFADEVAVGNYRYQIAPAPSWIDAVVLSENLPAPKDGVPTQFLLVDNQQRFPVNAEQEHFTQMVVRFQTAQALTDFSHFSISFDPSYQRLTVHHLTRIRDGKPDSLLTPSSVKIVHREQNRERGLYEGEVDAFFILEDLRVGDRLDIAYTVAGTNPLFGQNRIGYFPLQWSVPISHMRVRVVDERGAGLQTKVFNSQLLPRVRTLATGSEYIWELRDQPAMLVENDAPVWYSPYARLQLSDFKDWNAVARWADQLFVAPTQLPPELATRVAEWRQLSKDPAELASLALRFVQDEIRYYGIEVSINAYKPFPPEEVLRRRYGDCKDKALLLVTLLRALGIEAYPALVNSQVKQRLVEFLPSAAAFDHAIAVATISGKRYWLDGTAQYQHGSLDTLGYFNFSYALVVSPKSRALVSADPGNVLARIDVEQIFDATDASLPITMHVNTRYVGIEAERMRARLGQGKEKFGKDIINYYARQFTQIEALAEPEITDDSQKNVVTVHEQYKLGQFFVPNDTQLQFPSNATELSNFTQVSSQLNRQSPLALYFPFVGTQKLIFKLPPHAPLNTEQGAVELNSVGFRYRRSAQYENGILQIAHEYNSNAAVIETNQLSAHVEAQRKMQDAVWGQITVTKSAADRPRQKLQSLIQNLLDKQKGGN